MESRHFVAMAFERKERGKKRSTELKEEANGSGRRTR